MEFYPRYFVCCLLQSSWSDVLWSTGLGPVEAASLPDLLHVGLSHSKQAIFLYPKQTRPTLTATCRARHRTARMNWWVSIRKRSAAPKASGEEPRQPLIPNTQEVSAGRAGRSTALWLPSITATAVTPRLTTVGYLSVNWISKLVFLHVLFIYRDETVLWLLHSLSPWFFLYFFPKNIHKGCLNNEKMHLFNRVIQICPPYHCSKLETIAQVLLHLRTNKCTTHTRNVHTDSHCQLSQRDDQSEAPVKHTLRGRVVKQSTVCIICTAPASHIFFILFCISVSHLPDSPSQGVYRGGWKAGFFFYFSIDRVPGEHGH